MALISVSKAARLFDVSRPTLQKALREGVITGEKVKSGGSESWQIDTAELARVYSFRSRGETNLSCKGEDVEQPIFMVKSSISSDFSGELAKELEDLKADIDRIHAEHIETQKELAAAQAVADERKRLLDDVMKLLPRPNEPPAEPKRRGFWARMRRG